MSLSPELPENEIREKCHEFLSQAAEEARRLRHNYIGVEHIFIALTRNDKGDTYQWLRRAKLSPRHVRRAIRQEVGMSEDQPGEVLPLTPRCDMVLSIAIFLADQDTSEVRERHVLMAILQEGESLPVRKLIELGIDVNLWLQRILSEDCQEEEMSPPPDLDELDFEALDDPFSEGGLLDGLELIDSDEIRNIPLRQRLEQRLAEHREHYKHSDSETPLLDRYGRDLTAQARSGQLSPAIARDTEIRALARTLARSKKNNPLLLGDAGVGKTAIVEGLAYSIANGTAPRPLLDRRIVQIEIGTLVAGTSLRGQFEERLIGIVEEVKRSGRIILFIDEIHTIVGAGDTIDSNLDAANILKPALARGEINCIGATTHEEYRRAIAQDPALARRFRTIDVNEPSPAAAILILSDQRSRLEAHHNVKIDQQAIEQAVELSVRYLPDRRLPDKALDLLDEACARVVIRSLSPDDAEQTLEVTPRDVVEVLAEWTGIPINELSMDEKRRLIGLEAALERRVIGQSEAVHTVAAAVRMARAGLNDPDRPLGVFLFVGPSGVGKTQLAQALAEFLFGKEDAMLRLDMSEFHDSHTVARLIGSPPGYKESNRGGQLTDGLRRNPYCVVLLDEVEKAAPEVFDLFLQIFDEGRLSDAHGRPVDARHAVFIMTSNIGTRENAKSLGFGQHTDGAPAPDFTPYLKQHFRPEFLNRLDEIVTFRPLTRPVLAQILDLQLSELRQRLSVQKLTLTLDESALDLLLRVGYDPVNGARPLRRAVERLLARPLSNLILQDAFSPGVSIVASADGDTLTFSQLAAHP
ncbi:ATP-dependent Clp protease ATP-binding subunit [Aggregatilineales bacterium SYSU G02658]